MSKPYVQSNYARKEDDDYQTVDGRCVQALVETVHVGGVVVDCCSLNGSAIVSDLKSRGFDAFGVSDAFSDFKADWVVTNPPYTRGLVDEILEQQIVRVQRGEFSGFAALLRNNFDFAKSRWDMFTNKNYLGQIHMMFRPWWSENRDKQPIHNFVWHIWTVDKSDNGSVYYWKETTQ